MTRSELQVLVHEVADQILGSRGTVSRVGPREESSDTYKASARAVSSNLAALIDHTNLKPEATRDDIVRLCEEAARYEFVTVCVHSHWVTLAHRVLRGSPVKVCSVAGFPTGAVPTAVKCAEAEIAVRNGAAEVDMVLPVGLLRQGEWDVVKQDIAAVASVTRDGGADLKVILETAVLGEREIAIACALARLAGAQFVKTSTGFHPAGGANTAAVALMRQVVGDDLGVKASGGIRTLDDALGMIAAGANRIGTSAGVAIAEASRK